MLKYYRKNDFVESVWPANSAFYLQCMFRPIALKQLNNLTTTYYVQLSRWSRGNASDCGVRSPWFNYQLWQGFLFDFCIVVVVAFFVFFVQNK